MQDFVKFKMAAAAILDVAQNPAHIIFQFGMLQWCYGAMFQISSKSGNKWPSYA